MTEENNLQNLKIVDPETKKSLQRIDIQNINISFIEAINKLDYTGLTFKDITALWTDPKSNKFYLEVAKIPVLIKEIFIFEKDNKFFPSAKRSEFNPFMISNYNNNDFYREYEKIVSFKTDYFYIEIMNFLKSNSNDNVNVVELLSSDGATISSLKKKLNMVNFIAVDIDFSSLKKISHSQIICADVNYLPLQNNSIDIFFSNSFHHIPETAQVAWNEVLISLKNNGAFFGVETQGIISKIILNIINFLPYIFIPKKFWEIKNEYNLISNWLSISLQTRFKTLGSDFNLQYRKNLNYIFYKFKKFNEN